jgi:hypothetical protein
MEKTALGAERLAATKGERRELGSAGSSRRLEIGTGMLGIDMLAPGTQSWEFR